MKCGCIIELAAEWNQVQNVVSRRMESIGKKSSMVCGMECKWNMIVKWNGSGI